jgi:hypothetical protein
MPISLEPITQANPTPPHGATVVVDLHAELKNTSPGVQTICPKNGQVIFGAEKFTDPTSPPDDERDRLRCRSLRRRALHRISHTFGYARIPSVAKRVSPPAEFSGPSRK